MSFPAEQLAALIRQSQQLAELRMKEKERETANDSPVSQGGDSNHEINNHGNPGGLDENALMMYNQAAAQLNPQFSIDFILSKARGSLLGLNNVGLALQARQRALQQQAVQQQQATLIQAAQKNLFRNFELANGGGAGVDKMPGKFSQLCRMKTMAVTLG